jgi:hypothetical protein
MYCTLSVYAYVAGMLQYNPNTCYQQGIYKTNVDWFRLEAHECTDLWMCACPMCVCVWTCVSVFAYAYMFLIYLAIQ